LLEQKMTMSLFRFFNPVKIISGENALDSLGYELNQLGAKRPLIVSDRGVAAAGLVTLVKEALNKAGILSDILFDQVPPDSSPQVVDQAAGMFREHHCDSIVSVGGGSVIDTGKAVNIVVTEGVDSLAELAGVKLRKPMRPFIAIPTTSGTGSEVTYAAMIRDAAQNKKLLFASFLLFPKTAILDPRMTVSLPPLVTAATAMDAMTHAIEACICKPRNPFSNAHSMEAIKLIRKYLPLVLDNGDDREARFYLANAACMAGAAFSNAGVGLIHALGHALGGVCQVPHGIAMNILLPYGLEYNLPAVGEIIGELLLPLAGPEKYIETPAKDRPQQTIASLREIKDDLYKTTMLPRTLTEAGVEKAAFDEIAQKAVKDPALSLNPLSVSYEDAFEILNEAYKL
jgi:alcohol dehydrogenase